MGCGWCSAKRISNEYPFSEHIPIAIIGLPGVGKTSIVEYLAGEYDPKLRPISTLGVIIRSVDYNGQEIIFYDCGGTRDHEPYWKSSIEESAGVIFVFNSLSIHHGYSFTKNMLVTVADTVIKKDIPILAVLLKAQGTSAATRVQYLLEQNFGTQKVRFDTLPSVEEGFTVCFDWLVKEAQEFNRTHINL